jgi:poly(ADP-ribose) glycohydrolase
LFGSFVFSLIESAFDQGCVQEEIRFCINPELIASRIFTEKLEDNESMIIIGAERFSTYSGYGSTFHWASDFRDTTPR